MNKSMVIGVVAGVAVATAGGVAGYTLLGPASVGNEQGSAEVIDAQETIEEAATLTAPGVAAQSPPAVAPVASQSAPTAAPVARQSAPAPAPAPAAPRERCWDEEVTVTEAPKDEHRIGGTAAGAVVGGAIGREIGDNDLSTAVGAAAGAFIGRRIQGRVQENNSETRTTTRIERRCEPI
jgi:uncharacterized protein YcfJ